ncbi:MAG: bifunctional oligoribonuclease/PAP phosphatase NrnA [Spirochaetaceae bacterium]|jgi:phosphoesterase RecJ-like protein|nr:bifunctional oligoribonuclease/PAP phosphatase NrnA [Spirochaetaceae bacterium]
MQIPLELLDFIQKGRKFLIAGHKEPDGDCVGSQIALNSALKRIGKESILCSAGPFKRPEIAVYADRFTAVIGARERSGARAIVLDCSAPHRTGDLAAALADLPVAVIDHHVAGEHGPSTPETPVFLDPLAPSVTVMIFALIEALGLKPTKEEAEFLLFGLCTDTGFFRHTDETGAATFEYASRMIRCGASPKRVFQHINGGKSLNSRYLLGIQLSRVQAYFEGRLMLTDEEYGETQRFGLEGRDSDALYQLLQSVAGVEAIAVIRQETPENCTIGLRSKDAIDVAAIAAAFGGGGHKNAAGISIPGTVETVRPQILEAFKRVFR